MQTSDTGLVLYCCCASNASSDLVGCAHSTYVFKSPSKGKEGSLAICSERWIPNQSREQKVELTHFHHHA
jgi:hypothetical protein